MSKPTGKQFSHRNRYYRDVERGALLAIGRSVMALRSGDLTAAEFRTRMKKALEPAHVQAARAGRRAAGSKAKPQPAHTTDEDLQRGAAAWEQQAPYLQGFTDDIRAGRYDDEIEGDPDEIDDEAEAGDGAVGTRAELYGLALLGTAMKAWAGEQDGDTLIRWVAQADACSDCEGYAAGSPYPADELPAYPADGSSQCLSRCRCELEVA